MLLKNVFAIRIFCSAFLDLFLQMMCFRVDFPLTPPSCQVGNELILWGSRAAFIPLWSSWGEQACEMRRGGQNERARDRVCQKRLEKTKEETV